MNDKINSSDIRNNGLGSFDEIKEVKKRKKDEGGSQDKNKGTDDDTFIKVFNELLLIAMSGKIRNMKSVIRYDD